MSPVPLPGSGHGRSSLDRIRQYLVDEITLTVYVCGNDNAQVVARMRGPSARSFAGNLNYAQSVSLCPSPPTSL